MSRNQLGFTLLEVLIALVILAVGLLGVASLTMNSLQASQGASMRSQANALASDFAERLRANRAFAISNSSAYVLALGAATANKPACANAADGCDASGQAALDMAEWRALLNNNIPGATAIITKPGTQQYVLTLTWVEAATRSKAGTDLLGTTDFTLRIDL